MLLRQHNQSCFITQLFFSLPFFFFFSFFKVLSALSLFCPAQHCLALWLELLSSISFLFLNENNSEITALN